MIVGDKIFGLANSISATQEANIQIDPLKLVSKVMVIFICDEENQTTVPFCYHPLSSTESEDKASSFPKISEMIESARSSGIHFVGSISDNCGSNSALISLLKEKYNHWQHMFDFYHLLKSCRNNLGYETGVIKDSESPMRLNQIRDIIVDDSNLIIEFEEIYNYDDPQKWRPVKKLFHFYDKLMSSPEHVRYREVGVIKYLGILRTFYDVMVSENKNIFQKKLTTKNNNIPITKSNFNRQLGALYVMNPF